MKQEEMAPTELAKMTVVYSIPGMEAVTVRRDVPYRDGESGPVTYDVYYPPGVAPGRRHPAVLIVYGYSDAGLPNVFGRLFKEMGQTVLGAWKAFLGCRAKIMHRLRHLRIEAEAAKQHQRVVQRGALVRKIHQQHGAEREQQVCSEDLHRNLRVRKLSST